MTSLHDIVSLKSVMEESLFEILVSNLIKDLSNLLDAQPDDDDTLEDTDVKRKQRFFFRLLLNCESEVESLESEQVQIVIFLIFLSCLFFSSSSRKFSIRTLKVTTYILGCNYDGI